MPYKSQQARKEASRKSMAKRRGINIEGLTKEGLTSQGLKYHPVLGYLIDPVKREKLGRIILKLKEHNQLENVYFGCGKHCLPMDEVAGYYEATL